MVHTFVQHGLTAWWVPPCLAPDAMNLNKLNHLIGASRNDAEANLRRRNDRLVAGLLGLSMSIYAATLGVVVALGSLPVPGPDAPQVPQGAVPPLVSLDAATAEEAVTPVPTPATSAFWAPAPDLSPRQQHD